MGDLYLPPERIRRWVANFATRHGEPALTVADGALCGAAPDGSTFGARLPFGRSYDGSADLSAFEAAVVPPQDWGVLLVRKGGFAVARLAGGEVTASKVGRRHVQGRTKAGGQSQQRFARRRVNQARAAYLAAAGHAAALLAGVEHLVVGGDQEALRAVLGEVPALADRVVASLPDVMDPKRRVLENAVVTACSVRMSVTNA